MIRFRKQDVQKAMESLGFEVTGVNDKSFRASHSSYLNLVYTIDEKNDEFQVNAFFTGKSDNDRVRFLEAINTANRNTTVNKFAVDGDGDLVIKRCLPAKKGFSEEQLTHLIKEGDREVQLVVGTLAEFVE